MEGFHGIYQPASVYEKGKAEVNAEGREIGVENPKEVSLVSHPSFANWILMLEL